MAKLYMLVYSDAAGSREEIKSWADKSPLIRTWRYDLPHCIYLVSDVETAAELNEDFKGKVGTKGRHLFVEVNDNRQGWLTSDTWYFMRHKTPKPKAK